jgi:shikimate dehydrogenase
MADRGTYWRHAPHATYAVLGDPVGHSWSPKLHSAALAEMGRDDTYVALQVPLEEFDEALESLIGLGYQGVNCTVPLKEVAHRWAARFEPGSEQFGSINTLRLCDRTGQNTDVPGFLETLRDFEIEPPGPVLMLGAGGTARSLLVGLIDAGYEVRMFNRTRARAEKLRNETGLQFEIVDSPSVGDAMLVLNATSAGLSGEPLSIDWSGHREGILAYDLMYAEHPTPFLEDAQRQGIRAVDGRFMLVAQAALALEFWTQQPVSRAVMLGVLPQ